VPFHLDVERVMDYLLDLGDDRVETLDMPDTDDKVFRYHPDEMPAILCRRADGLLDQKRHPCIERLPCHREMEWCRDADAHGVNFCKQVFNAG
jgi:hypothetical protein